MDKSAESFKDDILSGISLAIKSLQCQQADVIVPAMVDGKAWKIDRNNPHFKNLLNYLDLTFSFGLRDAKRGYWPLVRKLAHASVIQMTEHHSAASSDIRKGYIWMYLTFIEDSMEGYLRMLLSERKLVRLFYQEFALLRDDERCEILMNFLAGLEALSFDLAFETPYLDYGHDPVLRQERLIIRVQPTPETTLLYQRDVPLVGDKGLVDRSQARRPSASSREVVDGKDVGALVHHISTRKGKDRSVSRKKQRRSKSEGDDHLEQGEEVSLNESLELEDDNYVPETSESPLLTVLVPDEPSEILQTSCPFLKGHAEGDAQYHKFLEGYTHDSKSDEVGEQGGVSTTAIDGSRHGEESTVNEDLELSVDIEEKLRNIELEGATEDKRYTLTYVSEDDGGGKDDGEYELYRSDSFDRFCRRDLDSGKPVGQGSSADENDMRKKAAPAVIVPPRISEESLARTNSPLSQSLSRGSIDAINDARFDTKTGILLPTLPRRPDLKDAMKRGAEVSVDHGALVLISLEVFQDPTESLVKMFEVSVGHLAGLAEKMFVMISNLCVYLVSRKGQGYEKELSVKFDQINKIQIGLNFQDVFIVHDDGFLHISTADEVTTRSLVSACKSQIKSAQDRSGAGDQAMASNTNNELEVIIQDWIICHTSDKEPVVLHFSLVHFFMVGSEERPENRVVKAGYLHCRHSILGVMSHWEVQFFALRGHTLYHYSGKKQQDLRHAYDLRVKCGGCVRNGVDDALFTFKILNSDGSSSLLHLACDTESEANDWIVSICDVVADARHGIVDAPRRDSTSAVACGMVMTSSKLLLFNQEPQSGRLASENTCSIQDITQVCVDNDDRTFCGLLIDRNIEQVHTPDKSTWFIRFHSEFELGKFEQKLFECWHSLYQVPLQFVLLSDSPMRKLFKSIISTLDTAPSRELDKSVLLEALRY